MCTSCATDRSTVAPKYDNGDSPTHNCPRASFGDRKAGAFHHKSGDALLRYKNCESATVQYCTQLSYPSLARSTAHILYPQGSRCSSKPSAGPAKCCRLPLCNLRSHISSTAAHSVINVSLCGNRRPFDASWHFVHCLCRTRRSPFCLHAALVYMRQFPACACHASCLRNQRHVHLRLSAHRRSSSGDTLSPHGDEQAVTTESACRTRSSDLYISASSRLTDNV